MNKAVADFISATASFLSRLISYQPRLRNIALVFVPALDADVVQRLRAEGPDVGGGEPAVGDQRYVEVYGRAAHLVAVAELLA